FRNVIIIMTSNLGSDIIRDRMDEWNNAIPEREEELLRNEILMLLRKSLRPEFLNRVDEIVMFRPLTTGQIGEIVRIQLQGITSILVKNNMGLEVTEEAIEWLTERGYDPQSGARPVKRLIQKEIVNELSREIIAGRITKDDVITLDVKDGQLCFISDRV
ncbi:MAG: AAA family ATPase, partial [Bacteroidales bacterium]